MYTSFMNQTSNSQRMGHSKGFRNRNQMIDPPTKESLQAGLEDS